MNTVDHPLVDAVSVGVFMALAELAHWPAGQRPSVLAAWRAAAVDVLPYRGDVLLYGAGRRATRKQRAEVAAAFGVLARGLAALATLPGGVPFAGRLFCAARYPAGATAPHPCPRCCLAELEEVPTTAPGGLV